MCSNCWCAERHRATWTRLREEKQKLPIHLENFGVPTWKLRKESSFITKNFFSTSIFEQNRQRVGFGQHWLSKSISIEKKSTETFLHFAFSNARLWSFYIKLFTTSFICDVMYLYIIFIWYATWTNTSSEKNCLTTISESVSPRFM